MIDQMVASTYYIWWFIFTLLLDTLTFKFSTKWQYLKKYIYYLLKKNDRIRISTFSLNKSSVLY